MGEEYHCINIQEEEADITSLLLLWFFFFLIFQTLVNTCLCLDRRRFAFLILTQGEGFASFVWIIFFTP